MRMLGWATLGLQSGPKKLKGGEREREREREIERERESERDNRENSKANVKEQQEQDKSLRGLLFCTWCSLLTAIRLSCRGEGGFL